MRNAPCRFDDGIPEISPAQWRATHPWAMLGCGSQRGKRGPRGGIHKPVALHKGGVIVARVPSVGAAASLLGVSKAAVRQALRCGWNCKGHEVKFEETKTEAAA